MFVYLTNLIQTSYVIRIDKDEELIGPSGINSAFAEGGVVIKCEE